MNGSLSTTGSTWRSSSLEVPSAGSTYPKRMGVRKLAAASGGMGDFSAPPGRA